MYINSTLPATLLFTMGCLQY